MPLVLWKQRFNSTNPITNHLFSVLRRNTKNLLIIKILLIRFSSIGDIVLTTPVIRCLKKQLGAELHFLTKHPFRQILEPNPHLDKVISIEQKVKEVLPQLRAERYDYIIDLHKYIRSFLVKINLPFAKSYSFNKLNLEKWLLVNFKINRLPNKHIVDRYMEGIQSLGITSDGKGLDFYFPKNMASLAGILPTSAYTAIVIGAGRNTKALTVEQIVAIINKTKETIVLLGGRMERDKASAILQLAKRPIISIVGQISLAQSAHCVKNAQKVITGDTGLMHIAAAFHKPIYSVWGNTIPEFGMYPYYGDKKNQATLLEVPNLSCRPCSKIGFEKCPKEHFKCIKDLTLLF